MKYIKKYIKEKCFLQPMGEVTLQQSEDAAGWSGVNICVNNIETALFVSHAEYAEWLESKVDEIESKNEEKLANKVALRFKVGDWITNGYLHCKISDVLDDRYIVNTKFAKRSAILFKDENNYHLWTIQDAKDGDVMVTSNNKPFIYNGYLEEGKHPFAYCNINLYDRFEKSEGLLPMTHDEVTPATNKQREFLFAKMKEAGYEWNADKKELKKIEQKPIEEVNGEDEKIRKSLITFFQNFPYVSIEASGTNSIEAIAWLKRQGEADNNNN